MSETKGCERADATCQSRSRCFPAARCLFSGPLEAAEELPKKDRWGDAPESRASTEDMIAWLRSVGARAVADRLHALYVDTTPLTAEDRALLDREYTLREPATGSDIPVTGRFLLAGMARRAR